MITGPASIRPRTQSVRVGPSSRGYTIAWKVQSNKGIRSFPSFKGSIGTRNIYIGG